MYIVYFYLYKYAELNSSDDSTYIYSQRIFRDFYSKKNRSIYL